MELTLVPAVEEAAGWDRCLDAFLSQKERRSGSQRTVEGYSGMLRHFFTSVNRTLDRVTPQDVFTWAYGVGASGKTPSAITTATRLSCLSSFFRFLIRMGVVSPHPCDRVDRPRIPPSRPSGITAEGIRRLLSVIPQTPVGLRDRAIILVLVLTGRRRAEVFNLRVKDIQKSGASYPTPTGAKGGKQGKREFPRPAFDAICVALAAFGKDFASMGPEESLWPSAGGRTRPGLTSGTFYGRLQRYLKKAGLPRVGIHVFRHSAAKLRREAGESVEDISRFLDHSSLAVTTVYLRQLEGHEDRGWQKVAANILS
jgi:site-specific recombinase XerD